MKVLERNLNKRAYNRRTFLTCKGGVEILLTLSIRLDWFAKTCCSSVMCASLCYHQLEQLSNEARNRTEFQLSGCYNKNRQIQSDNRLNCKKDGAAQSCIIRIKVLISYLLGEE
jgi:hypothetical protein